MENVEKVREEMELRNLSSFIENCKVEESNIDLAVLTILKSSQLFKSRKKLHKAICSLFLVRFPDLEAIIPDFELFAKLALHLSKSNELTPQLKKLLNQQQLIAINLGLAANLGPPIDNVEFESACNLQIEAAHIDKELHAIAATTVSKFAPNLTNLIGSDITALLITYSGSLSRLSQTPACNIKMLGSKKSELFGYSSRATKNYQGVLYDCDLVQRTPPEFRDAVFRDLVNKVALVSRVDAGSQANDGSYGEKVREQIMERLNKKMSNATPKFVRPLPIPGLEKKDNRGGRQKRAMKKKFGMGEELKARNKVIFGVGGQFDELGEQFGATALEGFIRKTSAVDAPFQKKIEKKLREGDKLRK